MLTQNGKIKGFLEFVSARIALTNPALLAGAAGIMAQLAMQQTMDEITDYLATIDEKVDDVLRAQKDAVLADMIGVDFVIEEAMTIREQVGRVSEVTWSKVQATPATIARTQAYALRQLDALAEKMERKTKIGDLAKTAKEAESRFRSGSLFWLAASNCRTRSPCSNSTGCWTRLRTSWTGIASGCRLPGRTGWTPSHGAPSV